MFDCNLTQHVSQPTHIKGNILDLVLTSPIVTIENISVNPQVLSTFSDHFTISFDISCCPFLQGHQKPSYVFDFSKANFTDLCSFLLDFDFSACFQSYDIEFIWSTIKSIIFVAISLFVPKTYLKQRQEPKWFNSDIRHHHGGSDLLDFRLRFHLVNLILLRCAAGLGGLSCRGSVTSSKE